MAEDNETVVQEQEPVSEQEQVSPEEGQTQEPAQEQPEALTEEKVQAMIAEATARAVQEAKELGRRELQSQQDQNRAEKAKLQRQANVSARVLAATDETLRSLDPETQSAVELARLRAEKQAREESTQDDEAAVNAEAYNTRLKDSLDANLDALGIKQDDPRIDWGLPSDDIISGRMKFDASVAKILKENQESERSDFEKRLKALESKDKAEKIENNSVETDTSQGVADASDKEFTRLFNAGELPFTKANVDRANKLLKQE